MNKIISRLGRFGIVALAAAALAQAASYASASEPPKDISPRTFATPQAAMQAVIRACEKTDTGALLNIFGSEGKDIVESGDPAEDAAARAEFVQRARAEFKLIQDPANPGKMLVSIGKQDWPFPVPLVREGRRWHFDASEGRQEILARRIGANELDAAEICRGYVEAQFEYAQAHRNRGVPVYAQKIVSSQGAQDGLYWETGKDGLECPVPKGFAQAAASMSAAMREPYHGYYFRILTAQGPAARGGTADYIVNGSMLGGFALVAWPAEYGVSGIQTFMVDHDGTVYEAHLGPETGRLAAEMTEFDPDPSLWHPIKAE
jgi:hypothetical protein